MEVLVLEVAFPHEQEAHVVGGERLADLLDVHRREPLTAHLDRPQHGGGPPRGCGGEGLEDI